MVSQIVAAPADNPPFDITIADEYTTSTGLAENIFLETDRSKIPGFEAVFPGSMPSAAMRRNTAFRSARGRCGC